MADARLDLWMADVVEAIEIGATIGKRVLLLSTSTGGTLTKLALSDATVQKVAATVLVSPNFKVKTRLAPILNFPGMSLLLKALKSQERGFAPRGAKHAAGWTTRYSVAALAPMAEAVRCAARCPADTINVPALFMIDDRDKVVDAASTREVAAQWGGPAEICAVRTGDTDDKNHHVLAGDALSPGMTNEVARRILTWLETVETD